MKKVPLMSKFCLVILGLLICAVVGYADERVPLVQLRAPSDSIPKTVNVQGKLTTDSGGPIGKRSTSVELHIYDGDSEVGRGWTQSGVPLDSDGIYSVDFDLKEDINSGRLNFKNGYSFVVKADEAESKNTSFSASPYSFYASSSTWAQGDSRNQIIAETYIKDLKVHQTSMTITKGDGTHVPRDFIRASTYTFGIVKVGKGLDVSGEGVISVNSGVHVETATYAQYDYIGQEITTNYIKDLSVSGSTITIHKGDNTTTSDIPLAAATSSAWGVVSVPTSDYGLSLSSGAITISSASANQYGTVKVSSAITSNGTNVVYSSAIYSAINSTYTALNSAITSTYTVLNSTKANTSDLYSIALKSNVDTEASLTEGNVLAWTSGKWKPTSLGTVLGTLTAGYKMQVTSTGSIFKTYTIHLDTASFKDVVPSSGSTSTSPITSGGVWTGINTATTALNNAITSTYTALNSAITSTYTALNSAITSTYTALNDSKANLSDFYDIAYSSYVEVTDLAVGQALVWNG
ncbi:MAG: hypothetical protein J6T23_06160, partial [Elusimicrobia bacterium]|nr:hypothetical protein [Elusimicrobiota bacterium]